jgi:DNA-binding MarR family transcriptional regulator
MSKESLHSKPGHLIRRAQQISVAIFHEECSEFDITPVQYAVLLLLEKNEGLDQLSLGNLAGVDRSTMANLAERLEQRELIKRMQSLSDKRQKLLYLTADGQQKISQLKLRVEKVQERILSPLSKDEAKQFLRLLEKMVDASNGVSRAPLRLVESI